MVDFHRKQGIYQLMGIELNHLPGYTLTGETLSIDVIKAAQSGREIAEPRFLLIRREVVARIENGIVRLLGSAEQIKGVKTKNNHPYYELALTSD